MSSYGLRHTLFPPPGFQKRFRHLGQRLACNTMPCFLGGVVLDPKPNAHII